MDEGLKKTYRDRYQAAKQRGGLRFFPDIIYKDLVVSFGFFLLLVGLAVFIGVSPDPAADPSDTSYIPRPEWYFLWLFQLLEYVPSRLEVLGTTVFPIAGVLALLLLPFYDRNPFRHWSKRKLALGVMGGVVSGVIALTVIAAATTPPQEAFAPAATVSEQIVAGQDLYGLHCVECHGTEGEGGEITAVAGLEGVEVAPLNAPDFIYTRTDETIFNVVNYGQLDLGMQPFGIAYGGELTREEIESIVTFIRYSWDDRVEIPQEAVAAGSIPELAPDAAPAYTVHIEPIIRRTCISCHRPGKENGNYLMGSYTEVIQSGDHAPNMIAGDPDNSNLIRMLYREEIEAGGPMPPTKQLKEEWIDLWVRWVLAGMPETPEEASQIETAAP